MSDRRDHDHDENDLGPDDPWWLAAVQVAMLGALAGLLWLWRKLRSRK